MWRERVRGFSGEGESLAMGGFLVRESPPEGEEVGSQWSQEESHSSQLVQKPASPTTEDSWVFSCR